MILKKIFEEITFFGGIAFYLMFSLIFLIFGKVDYFSILIVILTIIYLISLIIRLVYFKQRPKKVGYKNFLGKIDASSFPSIHSARAVFIFLFLAVYVLHNNLLKIFLFVITLLVLYSRIYLKKHDIIDILGGTLLGIFLFIIVLII